MKEILNKTIFKNTLEEYLISIGIFVLIILLGHIIKKIILTVLRKKLLKHDKDRIVFIDKSLKNFLIPAIYIGALFLSFEFLSFGPKADKVIGIIYAVLVTWFGLRFLITALNYFLKNFLEKYKGEEDSKKIKPILGFVNLIIWIVGILFLLDNLGFQISTIIAGLGITGIAVALAAQALLGDLFSYFVIFFDQPFELGDMVVFEGNSGTIEKIGIKTTRIRALSGEQLIVSNSKLTNSLVQNNKRMEKRRVLFTLGFTYQTKFEHLKRIPEIIKKYIEAQPLAQFDRAHFKEYGSSSLNFEIVYYILSNDYLTFMNVQQKINLDIFEEIEKLGIEFAYPTQTLFINKEHK